MKRLLLIPLILSAFFLFSGTVSAGGGGGNGGEALSEVEVDETETVPFDFIPLSTSEIVPGKGRFSYYLSDTVHVGNLTASIGIRLEEGDLPFHDRLQEVCTNNETVVAEDNSEWMAGVDAYFRSQLEEFIEDNKGKKASELNRAEEPDSWGIEQSVPTRLDYLSEEDIELLPWDDDGLDIYRPWEEKDPKPPIGAISNEDAGMAMALMLVHQTLFEEAYRSYWESGPEGREKIMKSVLVHWARVNAEQAKPRR